jgi:hypothetical protein
VPITLSPFGYSTYRGSWFAKDLILLSTYRIRCDSAEHAFHF